MDEIIEMKENGMPIEKISKNTGLSKKQVIKSIGQYNYCMRNSKEIEYCKNCRWKPCVGSPVCYKKLFG